MSGHVTWVGTSSAESSLQLEQLVDGEWKRLVVICIGRFCANIVISTVNPYSFVENCMQVHRGHLCPGGQRPAEQGQRLYQPLGGGWGGGGEALQARGGEQSQVRT